MKTNKQRLYLRDEISVFPFSFSVNLCLSSLFIYILYFCISHSFYILHCPQNSALLAPLFQVNSSTKALQYLKTSTRDLYNPYFKLVLNVLSINVMTQGFHTLHIDLSPISKHKVGRLSKRDVHFWAYAAVRKKRYTLYAASLINCLAGIFQMAGTVMTHLTSALSKSAPAWSLSSCIQWENSYFKF